MPALSRRSRIHGSTNALTNALLALRARGVVPLQLAESNPTCVGLAWDERELSNILVGAPTALYEPEPFGLLSARQSVSQQLASAGFALPPEHIMLTASTSEAYAFLFKLLCDPGDRVLVPSPSYPLFDMLAALEGVELCPYQLAYDGEWHLDMSTVQSAISPNTRAILLVHPNNPTGSYLKRDELSALAKLGLPLISDEVFAEYPLRADPRRASSALEASEDVLVFRMGGLSKSLLLPQLKLAWTAVAGPADQVVEARERLLHIADTYLSVATPVQLALPDLLERGSAVRARLRERTARNLARLTAALADSPVTLLDVEAGWYAILRLPAFQDDEAWALQLLEAERVLVQPGFFYDLAPMTCVVISLITEESEFAEGVSRLARCVANASAS
jgi:alanine-synthesizing transaminase